MSHHQTSYHEKNGLGYSTRHVVHPGPSPAHVRAVNDWFRVWHSLTPHPQAMWRALSKVQQDATKTLDAADFALVMHTPIS
jgi:hypothetical protein